MSVALVGLCQPTKQRSVGYKVVVYNFTFAQISNRTRLEQLNWLDSAKHWVSIPVQLGKEVLVTKLFADTHKTIGLGVEHTQAKVAGAEVIEVAMLAIRQGNIVRHFAFSNAVVGTDPYY